MQILQTTDLKKYYGSGNTMVRAQMADRIIRIEDGRIAGDHNA